MVTKLLADIKNLLKNKNWVKFTEAGFFAMSGRIARDLASAYENWLIDSSIPEEALAQVSARTLAKIGKVEPSIRLKIEGHLQTRNKYTENDLSYLLKNTSSSPKLIKEKLNQSILSLENMTDEVKLEKFPRILVENIKLKKKVKHLNSRLIELKSQISDQNRL